MNRAKRKQIASGLAIASLLILLAGCGSGSNNGQTNYPGYIPGGITAAGCVPLGQPIGFSAANAYIDRIDIAFGSFPTMSSLGGRTYGQVTVGSGATGGALSRATAEGTISVNVNNSTFANPYGNCVAGQPNCIPTTTNYTNTQANQNISGVINLSAAKVQAIQYYYGGYGYNTGYNNGYTNTTTSLCVQNVAVWMVWNPPSQIISVEAYVILSNGTPVQVQL